MKISELSRATSVSVPTIKYYVREGLLPRGDTSAPNQAEYGDRHLRRLRLIRALTDIGGLDLKAVRRVLAALDDQGNTRHEVLGIAHHALGPAPDGERREGSEEAAAARAEVDTFLSELGWDVSPDAPARRALADALVALRRLGWDVDPDAFLPYARAAHDIAAGEVESIATAVSDADLLEAMVVGTVVFESVLTALRRLAQEHHSATRFSGRSRED